MKATLQKKSANVKVTNRVHEQIRKPLRDSPNSQSLSGRREGEEVRQSWRRLPPMTRNPGTPPVDVSGHPDRLIRDRHRSRVPSWSRHYNRGSGDDNRVWDPDVDSNPYPCMSRPSDGNQSHDNESHYYQFRQILCHDRFLLL